MAEFRQLYPPVYRAATILFPDTAAFLDRQNQLLDGFSYGLQGTPTTRALEDRIASIEGGTRSILLPSGLAAITHPLLALCAAGDHILIVDCAYGASRTFASSTLHKMGVRTEFVASDLASIRDRLRPETRIVLLESPGYYTMEIQDIAAIAAEAHAAGARVMIDNTWGFGATNMFAHGADICCTALSKYAAGSGDLCLGSVTVADPALFRELKSFCAALGAGVSSDEAYLVLRGLDSLEVRLREHACRADEFGRWLTSHPAVARVLSPPLPTDRFHSRYRQYFRSGNGLFSVLLHDAGLEPIRSMLDGFRQFRIGASWGSPHSLVAITEPARNRHVDRWDDGTFLVRLHIGLEPLDLLRSDLEEGLARLRA